MNQCFLTSTDNFVSSQNINIIIREKAKVHLGCFFYWLVDAVLLFRNSTNTQWSGDAAYSIIREKEKKKNLPILALWFLYVVHRKFDFVNQF